MPLGSMGAAAGSLGAGVLGYFAAGDAGRRQQAGQERQYALQQQALEMNRPFAQMGTGAMTTLANMYGIGANGQPTGRAFNQGAVDQFRNTPGYQFARGEGLRATDFGDSARGQLLSSNNLRGRSAFATGLADQTFRQSYVQPMLSLAGIGQQGAAASGAALGNMGNTQNSIGQTQAGTTVSQFNALGQGAQGAFTAYNQNQQNQQLLGLLGGNKGAYGNLNTQNNGWNSSNTTTTLS